MTLRRLIHNTLRAAFWASTVAVVVMTALVLNVDWAREHLYLPACRLWAVAILAGAVMHVLRGK